ncbi:MAG: DUF3135 domain-containing protein [Sterolibacterium sp.]
MTPNAETSSSSLKKDNSTDSLVPRELPSHEELSRLAHDDPQAYETLRREFVENFIENAPDKYRKRLRGIQFRVDHERQLSHTALGSTVRVYKMMWDSFLCLNSTWQEITGIGDRCDFTFELRSSEKELPKTSAQILEFKPPLPLADHARIPIR